MGRSGGGYYGDPGYYQHGQYDAWDDDTGWEKWEKVKGRDPSPDRLWRVTKLKVEPTAEDLLQFGYEDSYDPYWHPAPPPPLPPVVPSPPPWMSAIANPRPYYSPLYPPAAPPNRFPVYY